MGQIKRANRLTNDWEERMAQEDVILQKMRAAQVQPHAFPHSLESLKQKSFALAIKEKKFDKGIGGLVSYTVTGKKAGLASPSMVCQVAAKELVLQGRKVYCPTLADLILRGESEETIAALGRGYFVISDLSAENTSHCTAFQWDTVQSLLLSNISRGGGLIIGTTDITILDFNADFLDALTIFESVKVV